MDQVPPAQPERERAIDLAYRAIATRDRTISELRSYLQGKRVEPAAIADAVETLVDAGFLDDARYARQFAEDKRTLERWGSERIARDLRRRGVGPELVEAAVASRGRDAEMQTAMLLLEASFPEPPADDRGRDRAWSLLVRRGYEPDLAYEAVRRHGRRGEERCESPTGAGARQPGQRRDGEVEREQEGHDRERARGECDDPGRRGQLVHRSHASA
jgi:regulatory protein